MTEQTEGAGVEIRSEAQMYYDRTTLASALQSAKERIAEWDYDKDAHGYCHERPDWLRLVETVEGIAAREAAAEARGAQAVLAAVDQQAETTVPLETRDVESYQAGFLAAWDAARAAAAAAGGGAR